MPAALIWLIAALGLAGAEALTGDMFLLMLCGGALAAAGSSWLRTTCGPRCGVPGGFGAAAGARPPRAAPASSLSGTGLPEPAKALEGKSALVLDRVARHEGQVKLDGEVWTARPCERQRCLRAGRPRDRHAHRRRHRGSPKSRLEKPGQLRKEPAMDGAVAGLVLVAVLVIFAASSSPSRSR